MPPPPALAYFVDLEPPVDGFLAAVHAGLAAEPRTLPPRLFYDERGSELFRLICESEEYYPTRTEVALLARVGTAIADAAGPGCAVVELGCGSSLKIHRLLEALRAPREYVAIDISPTQLRATAEEMAGAFPGLRVGAVCADFCQPLALPGDVGKDASRRLGFFPGSTIGNQTPGEAQAFLDSLRPLLGAGGALLVGVDLKKDPEILDRAYNDRAGHTAAFNLNVLARINRELGAAIDLDRFAHRAAYNAAAGRIEMHLESLGAQTVEVGGRRFEFAAGETIHTESSYKYGVEEFAALATAAGYDPAHVWTDAEQLFSIHFLEVR